MKSHYATMIIVTEPVLQSNVRAETDGNRICLQKVTIDDEQRTLLTGVSIRWAIREAFIALMGSERLFRHHNDSNTLTGYSYGPENHASLQDAMKYLHSIGKTPNDFLDRLFGMMVVAKGVVNNDLSRGQWKARSGVLLSDGIALSPFAGETTFHQGVNPKDKVEDGAVRGGDIAPYTVERDFTRYQYRVTFDLNQTSPVELDLFLQVILAGLRVGGGHARAESEVSPAAILWTFYHIPGGSGIYLPQFKADSVGTPDLTPFFERASDKGVTLYSAGKFTRQETEEKFPETIRLRDARAAILEQSATFMKE